MTTDGLSLLSTLDLSGRAFRAREGPTSIRGRVVRTSFDGTYARIDISDVERKRRDDTAWSKLEGFDAYVGRNDTTSVWTEPDGGVNVSITYIGEIQILPPGVEQ